MEGQPTAGDESQSGNKNKQMSRSFADVVVGGQAGSEGKGAVVAHLMRTDDYAAAVRPGSSNAGHTVYADALDTRNRLNPDNGRWREVVHQVIPSAATVEPDTACYMAPESSFGLHELFEEHQDAADLWGDDPSLAVDPKAAVITDEHRHTEADRKLGEDIGSTVHGCGAVRVEKIWRSAGDVRLAADYNCMDRYLSAANTGSRRVHEALAEHGADGEQVIVEGTQGTLLSMNQSPHWPFSTSRDCTASAFLSSCGLPPTAARRVWAVFRTYPIRVGGHSGPMDGDEIDFETVAERAGHDEAPVEFTSVTKKKRRIFEWSWEQFEFALRANDPDLLALTFLDYLDADNYGANSWWDLTEETREWVLGVDRRARRYNGSTVALLKTGPLPTHTVDLRTAANTTRPFGSPPWLAHDLESVDEWGRGGSFFEDRPVPGVNYARDGDDMVPKYVPEDGL